MSRRREVARSPKRNYWRLMSYYARYTAEALSQTLINRIDPVQFNLIQIWLATFKMSNTQVKACRLGASRVAVKSFGAQGLIRDFSLSE